MTGNPTAPIAPAMPTDAVREALADLLGVIDHLDIREGVCCCGDNMDNHADPMSSGHVPVDMGEYYHGQVIERARALLAEPARPTDGQSQRERQVTSQLRGRGLAKSSHAASAPKAPAECRCPKCGAQADERWDCCQVHSLTAPANGEEALDTILLAKAAAQRHAVELEQCSIFAADVGPSIAKAMTDAAAWLRAGLRPTSPSPVSTMAPGKVVTADDVPVPAEFSRIKAHVDRVLDQHGDLYDDWSAGHGIETERARMKKRIGVLEAEVDRLREALAPFARAINALDAIAADKPGQPITEDDRNIFVTWAPKGTDKSAAINVGDLRRARAAVGERA